MASTYEETSEGGYVISSVQLTLFVVFKHIHQFVLLMLWLCGGHVGAQGLPLSSSPPHPHLPTNFNATTPFLNTLLGLHST